MTFQCKTKLAWDVKRVQLETESIAMDLECFDKHYVTENAPNVTERPNIVPVEQAQSSWEYDKGSDFNQTLTNDVLVSGIETLEDMGREKSKGIYVHCKLKKTEPK